MRLSGLILLSLILLSCHRGGTDNYSVAESRSTAVMANMEAGEAVQNVTDRKLIRTGNIDFQVADVAATTKAIEQLTTSVGGYVSSENQASYDGNPRYEQAVRIPEAKLDEFIIGIEGLAKVINSKTINSQDVTEEFIDVESRLATKKSLEQRYLELLNKAVKVQDILEIETQLGNVRADIESMEGRLKYLSNQVAFSTMSLSYYQVVAGSSGFGHRLASSFVGGWNNMLTFFVGLASLWPFLLMIAFGIWLFRRWKRRTLEQPGESK